MAQGTLQTMAREVQAYCPSVPYHLARQWIINRYRSVTENLLWSFKIGEGTFFTPDAYSTGTVTMTNGSATVTGSGTTFTSGMVGRQFKVGSYVFTISAYTSATQITIDQTWYQETEAGLAYTIVQAYITPTDSDFHAFISVIDPVDGRRLHTFYNAMELNRIDPQRSATGTPVLIASRVYNSSNVPTFELWPHSSSLRQYKYLYEKRIADLSANTSSPPNIIRSDILVKGALADLSRWPGTRENPNPMYDTSFAQYKTRDLEFREEISKILTADQNIYMTDLSCYTNNNFFPIDSNFLQNHAY